MVVAVVVLHEMALDAAQASKGAPAAHEHAVATHQQVASFVRTARALLSPEAGLKGVEIVKHSGSAEIKRGLWRRAH